MINLLIHHIAMANTLRFTLASLTTLFILLDITCGLTRNKLLNCQVKHIKVQEHFLLDKVCLDCSNKCGIQLLFILKTFNIK